MTVLLISLVLAAALLHAVWNALVKSGGQPEFTLTGLRLVATLLGLIVVMLVPAPAAASWPWLIASVIIHNIYYFTLAKSYRAGDLSQVYPIFRGLAPVLVALSAALMAGEYLPIGAVAGIVLISVGIISLAFERDRLRRINRTTLFWGLSTSLMIAMYTVCDGIGIRLAESRLGYIGWLFVLEIVPIGLYVWITQGAAFAVYFRQQWRPCVISGMAASAAYGMVIFAMSLGAMAVVSSLRETSVIFAALIGTLFLGERFGLRRIAAAVLVAAGAIIMQLALS